MRAKTVKLSFLRDENSVRNKFYGSFGQNENLILVETTDSCFADLREMVYCVHTEQKVNPLLENTILSW